MRTRRPRTMDAPAGHWRSSPPGTGGRVSRRATSPTTMSSTTDRCRHLRARRSTCCREWNGAYTASMSKSEEHTSELQSQSNLVCRLLLEKKKKKKNKIKKNIKKINK